MSQVLHSISVALAATSFLVGKGVGLYRGRHRIASIDKPLALLVVTAAVAVPAAVVFFVGKFWGILRSVL